MASLPRPAARALGLKSVASLLEALDRIGVRLKPSDGDEMPIDDSAAEDELPIPPGPPTTPGTRARSVAMGFHVTSGGMNLRTATRTVLPSA